MLELLRGLGLIRVTVLGPLATIDVGHAGTPRNMLLFAVSTMGPAAWLGTTMLWVAHMLGKLGCEAGMLHCLSRCGEQSSHACRSHLIKPRYTPGRFLIWAEGGAYPTVL